MKNNIKRKKVSAYLQSKLAFSDDMASTFYFPQADKALLTRINQGDETALMQLAFINMPVLSRWVDSWQTTK